MPAPSITPKAAINLPCDHPVAHRTCCRTPANDAHMITPSKSASHFYPKAFLAMLAMLVMDEEMGKLLNYLQVRTHTKFAHIWDQSYSNEMDASAKASELVWMVLEK